MRKILSLLMVMLASIALVFADEPVQIASGTFDGKNSNYTEGWTTTGTGKSRNDCIIIGVDENITSPEVDLSQYESISVAIKARRYGNLTGSKAEIAVTFDGEAIGNTVASGTSATTALDVINYEVSDLSTGNFVVTCSNATSAGSTHGAGINSIVITGVLKSQQGGGEDPQLTHTYTVAGDNADLFGTTWAPTNTDNDMTLVEGVYTWEKTNMTMPAGNVAFKVVEDHSWDNASYPADNYVLNIPEAGIYTITITYNPADNNAVNAAAQKTGSAVVIPTVAMHGNFGGQNWADTENFAVAEGNETASLTLNLAAGDYEFGMRIGDPANWTANGAAFTRENNSAVIAAGSGNITFEADAAGEYTFTWTYATNTLTITYPEYVPPTYNYADGYYLIGLDMADWTMEYMPTEGRLFAANPDNEGEYQLTITLAADQQFKVVSVQKDQIKAWYPDGMDNNFIVDAAHAGEKTVYFRPDGQGGEGWHYGVIFVAANEEQPEQPEEGSVIVKWDADAEQVIGQVIYHAAAATASTKIHNNEDDVTAINLSKSYKYADDQYVVIKPATGTFKAGDKVTFNTFINNATADGSKYGAVYFYAADGATVLFQGQNGINGRTSNDEPVVENFTLEADQDSIMFGRYGNTATYVSVLNVTRVGSDEPIETPKFYITGNAALVGQDKEWNPGAIPSMEDSKVLALEAGSYMMKITTNGAWEGENNVKGYDALTGEIPAGVTRGENENNDNICFALAEAGDVTVTYTAESFTIAGNFYVAPVAKYYLIGDSAFVVDAGATADKAWTPDAIASFNDTTVLNLKAGVDYIMRLSLNGTWENHRDFRHLTDTAAGLIELPDEFGNHSIGFRLNEAGPVTIIYIPATEEHPEVFKLIGNFYVAPAPDPTASVRLEIMEWDETPFELAADKQSASLTIEDIHHGNYAFKMFINGEWRSNAGTISRENPAAIVAGNEEGNMTLKADVDGIYTFTWFFANDSLVAIFPEKPEVPMTEIRLVPGVWNVDGAKFAAVTWNEGEVMEDGVVSDWFVGTDTVVGNIPAAADSIGFARFNGEAAAPSIEDQSIIWNHTDKMLIDKETMIYTITGWPEEGKDYCPGYWGAPYVPVLENGFYLVGNKYNWTPAAERLFTANPETDGEYFLAEVTLEENDSIKVVKVVNDEITDWYPNGDNYVVDAAHAGVKDIYFNPTYQEAWGNNIYIEANAAPFACDWNNIAWLEGSNEQIKVCHENPMMKVVNVQNPHWSATTEDGIYMTFPSAAWGEISLPEGKYEIQGAGILVYLSALTQEYNEISIVCQDVEYIINIYNAANAPKPVYYLVGTLNEWTAAEAYKFGKDETCAEGEYILHATLTIGDEIKVIGVLGNDTTWYPAEAGNYNIDDAHAGEAKAIYFRPNYNEEWAAFGGYFWIGENQALLDAPDAAPAAPTYAGYQVHAAYSATYNADCNFGEWGSGTQYTQEEYGKKYVTTGLGYFGLEFTGMDCSEMEALHLDVWTAADASIRVVPIHGGTEVGVTVNITGQAWNAIDIPMTEFAGVTNWSNVYQIKIDNASNLTFWLNNVYFYTTQEKTVDLVDGYYLIGNINGWDIHNLTADHLFAQNPDNEAEYVLHYTLAEGNEFKVVAVANNELGAWYPGEAGNYVVDFAHAGEKDIYFRPDYQGGADWHASCIYVAVDESQVNPWETWFATGDTWNTETESYLEWDGENQKATIHINVDKNGQWRAQAKYHGPIAEAGKCYRVALKLKANHAINNVTIKYQDNVEMIYVNDAALEANVEYVFDQTAAGIAGGNGIMVLDFGYAHAGDIIEIYDVVIEETECPATRLEDGYYLIGLGMADWTVDYITADYLFTANPSNEGEYMLNITLAKDQQFKVVSVANDAIVTWYPEGIDNNYIVDENHYGETTIYFRPDGQGGEGWHYGMIYVAPVDHTAIGNIDANAPAVKILRDGQLLIIKGEKTFNAQGQLVK